MKQYDNQYELCVVDGETLSDMRLPPMRYCVEGLLPEGLSILGGAAKIGKSWLVLDLCVRVANGLPVWDYPSRPGDVLYLCLEDSLSRAQERLNRITDSPPANLFFAVSAGTIADGLVEQIRGFRLTHPALTLVVVDTFQVVRGFDTEVSYAGDYAEVRQLKELAEELRISLLLVHHLRKQKDKDPLNMLSGTTGISGAADAVYVLEKESRDSDRARLTCTGRDLEHRELKLRFSRETCCWECLADSLQQPETALPSELEQLVLFMRERQLFSGSNSDFAEACNSFSGEALSAKTLKQKMNRWRFKLEDCGVFFDSSRSNGVRMVTVRYLPPVGSDASDAKDAEMTGAAVCVTCVPCDPVPAL